VKLLPILFLLGSGFAASLSVGACSGSGLPLSSGLPDAAFPISGDGESPSDATDGDSNLSTSMRIANLAPWLGPIDLCVLAPGSGTFMGPLISPSAVPDASFGGDDGLDLDASSSEDSSLDVSFFDVEPDAVPLDGGLEDVMVDSAIPDAGTSDVEVGAEDAGAAGIGLAPFAMTRYFELKSAGTFEIAILLAGRGSCTAPYLTQKVTLDPGKKTTIVLGLSSSPANYYRDAQVASVDGQAPSGSLLGLLSFIDEPSLPSTSARTRFINLTAAQNPAALGEAVSVGVLDSAAKLWPLALDVDPGSAASPSSDPPVVDTLGYHLGPALHGLMSFRIAPQGDGAATSWTSAEAELDLSASSVHTGFIVNGLLKGFEMLWCDDRAEAPRFAKCTLVGQ
jgi:hypothetical protein